MTVPAIVMILKRLAIASLLVTALIHPVHAEEGSFVGVWRGQTPLGGRQVFITITFSPGGTYSQQAIDSLGLQTMQSGHYQVTGERIHFTVDDWAPKQLSHPPGSLFDYSFPQPGTLVLHDVNFNGTITMTKAE